MKLLPLFWHGWAKYLTVVVVAAALVMVRLGLWQYDRHHERAAVNAAIATALAQPPIAIEALLALPDAQRAYRPVTVTGTYTAEQILWRNREYAGATGFHILTVLSRADGPAVLINRGWIPYQAGSGDDWQTRFPPPAGEITVSGVWYRDTAIDDLSRETNPRKWFRIDAAAISAVTGVALLPGMIQIQPDAQTTDTTSPRPVATVDGGLGSHLGYTVQWFSFAVILLGGYTVLRYRAVGRA